MILETFAVPPLGCNCTVLADETTREAVIIDPGGDEAGILRRITDGGFIVKAIVHTHTHIDHVGATSGVQRATGAPARIHESDLFMYDMLAVQGQMLGMRAPPRAELDAFLRDGDVISAGSLRLEVLHTPGHTPGSVCFRCVGGEREVVFTGDTLFAGSIGRTDLWGGDSDAILQSIRRRLLTLPEDSLVVPGHEQTTTIAREKRFNPFVGERPSR